MCLNLSVSNNLNPDPDPATRTGGPGPVGTRDQGPRPGPGDPDPTLYFSLESPRMCRIVYRAHRRRRSVSKSGAERRCRNCTHRCRGVWFCVQCKGRYEKSQFEDWILSRTKSGLRPKPNAATRCNGCFQEQERKKRAISHASFLGVMVTAKRTKSDAT